MPWSFDFVQFSSSSFKMTVNILKSKKPFCSPHLCLSLDFVSLLHLTLGPCLELASGFSEVLPEEFLDLSPGMLLGCGMRSRVPSPEHGCGKGVIIGSASGVISGCGNAVSTGNVAEGCIGWLQEVACPRVGQHPPIALPVPLQPLQGVLSMLSAIDRLVILSYKKEDLTLGLFNRKHTPLIQFIPQVPPVVEQAHSP